MYYPQLRGIGLDYNLEKESENERLKLIRGDLFSIPFGDVADVTYCAYVLAGLSFLERDERIRKIAEAIFQTSQTLLPQGIAFVDEGIFSARQCRLDPLIEEIESSTATKEEKAFLISCAQRHLVFNYKNIADYYAHSNKEVQELMEKSALVIIDFDKAIENGYIELSEGIKKLYQEDYGAEEE